MTNEEMWQAVLGEIELTLSKAQFITWFKNTFLHSVEEDCIIVSVPNIFTKDWLENKYKKAVLDSIRKFYPKANRISCLINAITPPPKTMDSVVINNNSSQKQAILRPSTAYPQPGSSTNAFNPTFSNPIHETNLNHRYNFENFVVGSNNELAYAACRAVAENPGISYNPLFLYGGVGLGKTHLLQSTGNFILQKNPSFKIKYVSMERFANELMDAIQNAGVKEFKNRYINLDVLILDDVQFLAKKEKTQEELFHVFEYLYQHKKQIILSSDRPPKSISTLEDRLRSRFEGGMIADVIKPDLETRVAIINKKLIEKNVRLSSDIINYLAENIYHNVRELEGALNKIVVTAQLRSQFPSLEEIIEMTKDVVSTSRQKKLSPDRVVGLVAEFFNVKPEEISSRSRKKNLVRPRQVTIYLIRKDIGLSFPEIGQFIGGRDHSTVIYAFDKIEKELEENNLLQENLKIIREKFVEY